MSENKREEQAQVPFFLHENMLMHMSKNNKRILIALIVVCVSLLLMGYMFLSAYTAREKEWQNTIRLLRVVEVTDGVYEQPNS